jgi:hypothetical protein
MRPFTEDRETGTGFFRTLPGGLMLQGRVALGSLTTMGTGGDAKWFGEIRSRQDLQDALTWAKGHRGYKGWLPSNIESEPNNRRVNLSVSYAF